jgi:hypothetical protein
VDEVDHPAAALLLRRRPGGDPALHPGAAGARPRVAVAARLRRRLVLERLTSSRAVLVALAVVVELGILWALHDAIVDDAYISLDYARTLAFHGQWGAVPGIPANSATSPLNVLLLGAVTAVVRSPMAAMWALALANAALLALGLIRLGTSWRVGDRFAWIAAPLLIVNPIIASSTGLETGMTVTLLVWLLDAGARGRWRTFGWLAGVGVVLRPDLVIVVAVVWLLHPALRRPSPLRAVAATTWRAALVGLPWYAFSWLYFGSAIPDTLAVKRSQDWGHFDVGLWQRYYPLFPWAVTAVLTSAAAGAIALVAAPALWRSRFRPVVLSVTAGGLSGLAYYAAYTQLRVPPYFWYYAIPLASLTLVAAFGVSAASVLLARPGLAAQRTKFVGRALATVGGTALLAPMLAPWASGLSNHLPLREAPVHGNWALASQYRAIGQDLAERLPEGAVVRSAGEFGTILYYCQCTLIDRLDQRGLIMPDLLAAEHSSWLMRLNYLWLDPSRYPLLPQAYHLGYHVNRSSDPLDWTVWGPQKGYGTYSLKLGPRPVDVEAGLVP